MSDFDPTNQQNQGWSAPPPQGPPPGPGGPPPGPGGPPGGFGGPPPGQQFGGAPGGYAAPKNDTNAIIALVLGILSILCCCVWGIFSVGFGIGAVFLGKKSKEDIAASNGALQGEGMAQAGFICGIIGLVLGVLSMFYFVISLAVG